MIVKDRMTRNPIVVDVNATMSEAADTMTEKNLHRLPVIENGKLAWFSYQESDLFQRGQRRYELKYF